MQLLLATGNASKAKEFRAMLEGFGLDLIDLSQRPPVESPEETGDTFCENASIKATFYARHFGCLALADDSGLEVDVLHKKPGVHSARWAEMNHAGKGDDDNNRLLLRQMADVPEHLRRGRFVCCLALAKPSGEIVLTAEATMEGQVLRESRGSFGFGYDGLFRADGQTLSNGELAAAEKHRISHRGKALAEMVRLMRQANFLSH